MSDLFMRFPQGKGKALTLSYDDGVEQDAQLLSIMNAHGLKGTFNLNTGCYAEEGTVYPAGQIHRRMPESKVTELFANSGQEIAVHGLTHPWLEQLPEPMMMRELIADRENLERQFGTIVRGMAYPFGAFDDRVVEGVRRAGLVYARTTIASHGFKIPADWLRLEATCHHNDPALRELTQRFVKGKPERDSWLFYLWGHSYEFEADDNWQVIEAFAQETGNRSDIWYATNIQIYDYVQAFKRLEFTVDGSRVYNPSVLTVWFVKDGRMIEAKPGMMTACA